jgi:hypothetical protein
MVGRSRLLTMPWNSLYDRSTGAQQIEGRLDRAPAYMYKISTYNCSPLLSGLYTSISQMLFTQKIANMA